MTRIYCVLAFLLLAVPLPLKGQAQGGCHTDASKQTAMRRWVVNMATAAASDTTLANLRSILQIPAVASGEVVSVTSTATCESLAQAFSAAIGSAPENGRWLLAVQAGSVYVVEDTEERAGEFTRGMVLNQQMAVLSKFVN